MRKNISSLLIRVIVGLVFFTEGLLKFLRPTELGAGRFERIGLPIPHLLGPFVGGVEMLGGALLIFNLYAGDAAIALVLVISTAIVTTKLPILLGHSIWKFGPPKLGHYGILPFLHESRTDLCMLFGTVAIFLENGFKLFKKKKWYAR
ncbi:MAG: DoxX family protein [Acidobacteriota bacterium]|nr:DoxX family protein [Acidobacteriota bacterium]